MPSAASMAMEGATEEARDEVRALIEREDGTFLQAATADGFGIVGERPPLPDLSEPS